MSQIVDRYGKPINAKPIQDAKGVVVYRVQLGAFKEAPKNLFKNIPDLMYSKKEDGFLRLYSGTFSDEYKALAHKFTLVNQGHAQAQVVLFKDGEWIKDTKEIIAIKKEEEVKKEEKKAEKTKSEKLSSDQNNNQKEFKIPKIPKRRLTEKSRGRIRYVQLERTLPEGILVQYLDEQGNVLLEDTVNSGGYFKYKTLDVEAFNIRLINAETICDQVEVSFVEDDEVQMMMLESGDCLFKKSKIWKMRFDLEKKTCPEGMKCLFYGENDSIMYVANLDNSGYFAHHPNQDKAKYARLLLYDESEFCENVRLELYNKNDEVETMLVVDQSSCDFQFSNEFWKIDFSKLKSELPEGLKASFLDKEGNLIYETVVSESGAFAYKKLNMDECTLQMLNSDNTPYCDENIIIDLMELGVSKGNMYMNEKCKLTKEKPSDKPKTPPIGDVKKEEEKNEVKTQGKENDNSVEKTPDKKNDQLNALESIPTAPKFNVAKLTEEEKRLLKLTSVNIKFTVQIGVFDVNLPGATLTQYSNFKDVKQEKTPDGLTRYTVGSYSTLLESINREKQINTNGFQNTTVIGIYKGKVLSVQECLELLKREHGIK